MSAVKCPDQQRWYFSHNGESGSKNSRLVNVVLANNSKLEVKRERCVAMTQLLDTVGHFSCGGCPSRVRFGSVAAKTSAGGLAGVLLHS